MASSSERASERERVLLEVFKGWEGGSRSRHQAGLAARAHRGWCVGRVCGARGVMRQRVQAPACALQSSLALSPRQQHARWTRS